MSDAGEGDTLDKRRVIIADDSDDMRALVRLVLLTASYTVVCEAPDGAPLPFLEPPPSCPLFAGLPPRPPPAPPPRRSPNGSCTTIPISGSFSSPRGPPRGSPGGQTRGGDFHSLPKKGLSNSPPPAQCTAPLNLSEAASIWSGRRDLNPRPLRPERSALPNCATPRGASRLYRTPRMRPKCDLT